MRIILAIALVLSTLPVLGAGKPFQQLDVGKPFPVIDLPLATAPDKAASIMDFRGRKLMLHLFASW